jgi:modification target Cys-rich repeat protein
MLLAALGAACKKKGGSGTDAGRDGAVGDGGPADGARDLAGERSGDGGGDGGPVACNGRCSGTCRGVCTGICGQRTEDGECAGRCEEICVGTCEGSCLRLGRADGGDGGSDARDAGADRPRDLAADTASAPPGDGGASDGGDDAADAADPGFGRWEGRANVTTLSWPPAVHAGAMAYDSSRKRVVMFGGSTAPGNATWEWDGDAGAWELRQQMAGARPSRRYGHALAYDASRGKVVMVGGIDESGGSNPEVWEWDGTAETWTMKGPGPNPSRWGHAMAYHAGLHRIVLFGGSYRHPTLGDGDLFDIWEYDGAADSWVNKTYPLPPAWPRARRGHALCYDTARAVTVLYGGEVQVLSGPAADLWEWDSTTNLFTDRTPPSLPPRWPGPRAWHGMAYTGGKVLLYGGALPNFWEWDGEAGTWRDLSPPVPGAWPPPRERNPLAWDGDRRVLVLSGGTMMVGSNVLADLWEWSRP